ncbi:MAG TPA: hypothetical protein VLC28_12800 [Flavitalea sp.]|nr:hypothetical protein [Flavitalea sp.]
MSHLSDKDIDHLAREAAEQLDVDQNSSGWEALQAKLDVEMPVEKRRRRWLFFLLFPLLGGGLFLAYKWNQSPETAARAKQPAIISEQSSKSIAPGTDPIKENSTRPQDNKTEQSTNHPAEEEITTIKRVAETPGNERPAGSGLSLRNQSQDKWVAEHDRVASHQNSELKDGSSSVPKTNKSARKKDLVAKSASATAVVIEGEKQSLVSPPQSTDKMMGNAGKEDRDAASAATAAVVTDSINAITKAAPATTDSLDKQTIKSQDSATAASSTKKPVTKKQGTTLMPDKGFVIGILAGPDVSKVNGTTTDERGFNAGLQVGYRFNGRLTLISGVNYTHKYYTAKGADYKPAKGTWLDTVTLSKVVGDCLMYEVPVNIRYDIIAAKKNYLFASAGLSSYFMQKESYDFHYTGNSGNYNSRYGSYKVSDQYWFSVLNLSAGYERMLTKRLSLQVEPYLKLPLNGIGFGNMDLSSYGVFFGIRYHGGTLKLR